MVLFGVGIMIGLPPVSRPFLRPGIGGLAISSQVGAVQWVASYGKQFLSFGRVDTVESWGEGWWQVYRILDKGQGTVLLAGDLV